MVKRLELALLLIEEPGLSRVEREGERLLVLTESRYMKVRSTLVDRLMEWFAEAVRIGNGGESTSPFSADIEKFAQMYSVPELLRRYQALVRLQENLSRNIQEALAVEVAFIEAFGPEGHAQAPK